MSYAAEHTSALADVRDAGSAAVFTLKGQGAVDMATDTVTPAADIVISGYAIEKRPSLTRYAALGLIADDTKTLFFVPNTLGQLPALSSTIPWAGATYSVKYVEPLAPDGSDKAIAATIMVGR